MEGIQTGMPITTGTGLITGLPGTVIEITAIPTVTITPLPARDKQNSKKLSNKKKERKPEGRCSVPVDVRRL
jgi:hypothetical protein